jgi:DNA-nicking Smr family endonuclease
MSDEKSGKRISDEERRLWSKVVSEARPLKKRRPASPAGPASPPPDDKSEPAAPAKPRPARRATPGQAKKPQAPAAPELRHGSASGMDRRQAERFKRGKTGKGRASPQGGVLREEVPRWLNEPGLRDKVLSFDYSQQSDGGTGALYVLLKRRRPGKG